MPERLPSLPALRVFEAAGRLLSFTKAAAERHITPAAVSHQIRVLEDQLGMALFTRSTRRLALTAAGMVLLPAARSAFSTLERAVGELRRSHSVLTITTTPFFGAKWLAPRLGRFAARHPAIDLSVRHSYAELDLAGEGIDLAIRGGDGVWPGLFVRPLPASALTVVANPLYAARLDLRKPADLERAVLLHDESHAEWRQWLALAGVNTELAASGPIFDDEHVLLATARNGQGVALVMRYLVEDDIAADALTPLFELTLAIDWRYYLVCQPENAALPKVQAFCDFVLAEALLV